MMKAYSVKPLALGTGLAAAALTLFSASAAAQWMPHQGSMMRAPVPQWAPPSGYIQRPYSNGPYGIRPSQPNLRYGGWAPGDPGYRPLPVRTGPWIWPQAQRQMAYPAPRTAGIPMPRVQQGYPAPFPPGIRPAYAPRPYAQYGAPANPWMRQAPRYASPEGRVWRGQFPPQGLAYAYPYRPAPVAQQYYRPPTGYGYPTAYSYVPAPWIPQRPAMAPWQTAGYIRPQGMPPRSMPFDRRGSGYPVGKPPFDLVYHRGKAYAFPALEREAAEPSRREVQGQDLGYRGWQFGTERPAGRSRAYYPELPMPAADGIAQVSD